MGAGRWGLAAPAPNAQRPAPNARFRVHSLAMRGYRELEVWQVSMQLVEMVSELTGRLPEHQRFALVSQMQRAAISIPSNIAEGHAKRAGKDYQRHLRIAAGSTLAVCGAIWAGMLMKWLIHYSDGMLNVTTHFQARLVTSEIGAMLMEDAFGYLERPLRRLAIPDVPLPTARHLVSAIVPSADDIYRGVKALVGR